MSKDKQKARESKKETKDMNTMPARRKAPRIHIVNSKNVKKSSDNEKRSEA